MKKLHLILIFKVLLSCIIAGIIFSLPPTSFSQTAKILVRIEYQNKEAIRSIFNLDIQVITYTDDDQAGISSAVGLTTSNQINALTSNGFTVTTLDTQPEVEKYYLVYLRDRKKRDKLFKHGEVFYFTPYNYILKTTQQEAEKVLAYGFVIVKLPEKVEPPPLPPALAPPLCGQYVTSIQPMVDSVSQNEVEKHIKNLQSVQIFDPPQNPNYDANQTRWTYYQGNIDEATYIFNHLQSLGLATSYQNFQIGSGYSNNVIGILPGQDPSSNQEFLLVAHMDSTAAQSGTNNPAPGADDNGSGIAAIMEAARILSSYSFKHTLKFVAFSGEEQGLIGSQFYAQQAWSQNANIQGVINLDMIGNNSSSGDYFIAYSGDGSLWLRQCIIDSNNLYNIGLTACHSYNTSCNSDHCSFWNYSYNAIFGHEAGCGGSFSPVYHSTNDTFTSIRPSQVTKVTKLAVATLALLGEPPGVNPTPTPTPVLSPTPTPTPSPTPTPISTPTPSPTPPPINCQAADLDTDSKIDANDTNIIFNNFYSLPPYTCPPSVPSCQPDLNADGVVNSIDISIIISCWTG